MSYQAQLRPGVYWSPIPLNREPYHSRNLPPGWFSKVKLPRSQPGGTTNSMSRNGKKGGRMTTFYIRLISLLPRVKVAINEIEEFSARLTEIREVVVKNSQSIARASLTNKGAAQ